MTVDRSQSKTTTHDARTYRNLVQSDLAPVRVAVQETDLFIHADIEVSEQAKEAVITQRGFVERYIERCPDFVSAMTPWPPDPLAPVIIRKMIEAGQRALVGPMAAVAGAMAEEVGVALLDTAQEVIVENGGDLFISARKNLTVAVYADRSPLSLKVGLRLSADTMPTAVCTSSGTVGHSISRGRADAVCVTSQSCALADAAATAMGNRVQTSKDIQSAIEWGKAIDGLNGGLVIIGDQLGAWGDIELVPL